MDKLDLVLYITGHTSRSEQAVANLHILCDGPLVGRCRLRIVDVIEQPQLAEDAHVIVTPTLVKVFPEPGRRIIGDLSDHARVLSALDFSDCTH